jgi:hypothetical protein
LFPDISASRPLGKRNIKTHVQERGQSPKYHTKQRIHECEHQIMGEYQENKGERYPKRQMLPRTSVVLLLLMIVAELPLALCCHPTLCLHHLLYLVGATLETLGCIVSRDVGVAKLAD